MSSSKLGVGALIRIEYKTKWYTAEITEMTKHNIAIKLFKSGNKIIEFDIPRKPNWLNLVIQKKVYIIDKKTSIFQHAHWMNIGQTVCIITTNKTKYYQISKCKNGPSVTALTIDIKSNNDLKIIKQKFEISKNKYKIIVNTHSYLILESQREKVTIIPITHKLNNRNLFKKLLSRDQNKKSIKSSASKINVNITMDDIEQYKLGQYVDNSCKKCAKILNNADIFPVEVVDVILSFLQQNIIYICPPSICIKKNTINDPIFANDPTGTKFIGCNFSRIHWNNTKIIGFELYTHRIISNASFLYLSKSASYRHDDVQTYIAKCKEFDANSHVIEYIFDSPIDLSTAWNYRLALMLEMKEEYNYSWHEFVSRNDEIAQLQNWKIFKQIQWLEYMLGGDRKEKFKNGEEMSLFERFFLATPIKAFPHLALIIE